MTEFLDELDRFGNPTSQIVEKGAAIKFYFPAATLWIFNDKGQILLQKRAASKSFMAGKWAETGGAVKHGESVSDALKREVKEELGLDINPEDCDLMLRYRSGWAWQNVYFLRQNIDPKSLHFNDEVDDVKWFTVAEIDQLITEDSFIPGRWPFLREICRFYSEGINACDLSFAD